MNIIMPKQLVICILLLLTRYITAQAGCVAWPEDRQCFKDQTVYFQSGRWGLNAKAKGSAVEVAKYIKEHPSTAVAIEGHGDNRGSEEHNRRLAEKRAVALRNELIRVGAAPDRVDTLSYGKDRPADPGHSAEARSRNRRAEFVLLKPPK